MKTATTIRLDEKLKKKILRLAKQYGLTFSDIVNIALNEVILRGARIHPTKIPPGYLKELEREAKETCRLYKEGKIKGYTDPDEMMRDMLKECK